MDSDKDVPYQIDSRLSRELLNDENYRSIGFDVVKPSKRLVKQWLTSGGHVTIKHEMHSKVINACVSGHAT